MSLSRRHFLAGSSLLLSGCAAKTARVRTLVRTPDSAPRLARVRVAQDRVIRVTTGLRPFRPSGFVVRAEKLDDKVVVHNYGHGGAGITLSWGTSQLAVEEGLKTGQTDCAVIGCGVVGLSTARLLQQRGLNPVIYTKDMPPLTTSNAAGGYWEPVTLYDQDRVTAEFRRQFGEAARFAYRRYQLMAGDVYGVRWLPAYSFSETAPAARNPDSPMIEIDPLHPESKQLSDDENPFRQSHVSSHQAMLIEPSIYLNALIRDYELAGGKIAVREFASQREVVSLSHKLIFNCTGLGAKQLFGDNELTPIKGQLVFLLPQPEIDYMTLGPGSIYMFPRRDGILLGGSHDRDVWDLAPDPAVTDRILRENGALFASLRG